MFDRLKPLLLIHRELARIANCLEFLTRQEARRQGILWAGASRRKLQDDGTEPELFHTDPGEIALIRQQELEEFMAKGERDE